MIMKTVFYIIFFVTLSFSQYNYELIDINPNSDTYEESISPSYYPGQITLHYFGHQD